VLAGQAERSGGAIVYDGFPEFEAAVDLLLSDTELLERLGTNGRSYIEDRYRWDDLMVRYEDLLTRVVDAFDVRGLRGTLGR
jgi:glycosyltransferase involved in cell wall biosynthesis